MNFFLYDSEKTAVDLLSAAMEKQYNSIVMMADGAVFACDFYPNRRGNLKLMLDRLSCANVQMVPCTRGELAGKATLWMDEEGALNNAPLNKNASRLFGEQVLSGQLYGAVALIHVDAEKEWDEEGEEEEEDDDDDDDDDDGGEEEDEEDDPEDVARDALELAEMGGVASP